MRIWLPSSCWSLTRPTRRLSNNLDILGIYLQSCFRDCNRSPAKCTCYPPALQKSTNCDINSFVPSVERWSPVSSRLVRTLFMHALRANYQAAIWKRCLQSQPFIPSSKIMARSDHDGELDVKWMWGFPAPDVVLQLLSCNCSRSCKLSNCSCLTNDSKCTDMCRFQIEKPKRFRNHFVDTK